MYIQKRQPHLLLREDYDRKDSVEKKSLFVSLKELVAEANLFEANRQSYNTITLTWTLTVFSGKEGVCEEKT
jgi:hypothetical protein